MRCSMTPSSPSECGTGAGGQSCPQRGFSCRIPLRLACQAMRQLHPEAIAAIQSKVLFSKAEEQLLNKVGSVRACGTRACCEQGFVLTSCWRLPFHGCPLYHMSFVPSADEPAHTRHLPGAPPQAP